MKPSSTFRFSLLAALFVCALSVQANTVTYDLTFTGFFNGYGSGTATFDDTPAGPGGLAGETRYDFTSFVGSGLGGTWTSSYFDYDPTTGNFDWNFFTSGAHGDVNGPIGTGLSPIAALEQVFAGQAAAGDLTWSREASGVASGADGGSALALLGLGMAACLGLKRRWAKP
jgi:hypothetical protein